MNSKFIEGEKLFNKGISLTKISKELHLSRTHFTEWLKKKGYEIHNKQNESNIYYDIFDNIDSEEKAYWLGFMYADGSVYNGFIELGLQEKDLKHLEKFKKFLNSENKIGYKEKTKSYRIIFRNKHMVNSLIKNGCIPNKTYSLSFPNENILSKDLIRHFVRGFVDGDGYVGSRFTSKSQNHIRARLCLTGAVPEFLCEIVDKMNWEKIAIRKDKKSKAYKIEWSNKNTLNMLAQLYEGATIYLDRKYQKYIDLKNAVLKETT